MARESRRVLTCRLRAEEGQSLIEAVIVTPLLLLVTFGIIEFAALFYVNLALESGVSQATRYAITGATISGLSRQESIKSVMRSSTPTLTIDDGAFSFSHLAGGAWVDGVGGPGDVAKVGITYSHRPLVLRSLFTAGAINIHVESAMKNEDRFD